MTLHEFLRCPRHKKNRKDSQECLEAIKICSDVIDLEPNDLEGYYYQGIALS